ncbi:hypothetical protein CUT44_01050 [Streptomyces carminius]|uniref:Uncharacterized protein n=1 Tax=Streptomyces carminius TaxID=2665496 RepID=A0A2M8M105_9ACTN|nr:hypothetical protein [Streptomyces carminius]PJE97888.1 hypothetical protein CUT44_09305 [Streptomyces carminius]PJF01715.1 hypothetical protein CUT44_01050 [Streptomyces carminius]
MHANGAQTHGSQYQRRGHVLLVAGDRAVHRRRPQITPSANLAALATVPTPVLLDSSLPTDLVHLDGVHDPNSVLLRLRAAVAASGPVLLYLSGRLTADRRRRELHLALTGTTPGTVRYSALPWSWLRNELRTRPAGTTVVFADLAADRHAWARLQERPDAVCEQLPLCGVVVPPGLAGTEGVSPYTRQLVEQLRQEAGRPGNSLLHSAAVSAAALPPGTLVLPRSGQLDALSGTGEPRTDIRRLLAQVQRRRAADRSSPAAAAAPDAPGPPGTPPHPGPAPVAPPAAAAPAGPPAPVPARAPAATLPAVPRQLPAEADPRPVIWEAAQAGRHNEAAAMAAAWEQHAMRRHGPNSAEAVHWAEIRADLARIAENYPQATRLWIAAARSRLAHQSSDAPELLAAAQGAHYCWHHVTDPDAARELGPELLDLLGRLPALDPRHVPVARQRLEALGSRTSPAG